jgi:predicted  nucleic acid-binding Zn-ribbon protein
MRKVQVLHELQQIDTALDRARERLPMVVGLLADRSALMAVEAERQAADSELHQKSAEQRDLELEIQNLRDRLAELEKKLYSGTVMNPKELDAMTKEAQQFRRQISTREDRLLALFDEVEAASAALAEVDGRLQVARSERAEHDAAHATERDELERTIAQREQERAAVAAQSDRESLRIYDGLRRTRGGLAVAEVSQRTCQGCRVSLPVSEEIRARSSPELMFCQSCGRILHAGL